jgi:hypothetical protein
MMNTEDRPRVVVAITENAPIDALWRVTMRWLTTPDIELVALYVTDDRWQRVASLPFTREFSRSGRPATAFTLQRAQEVHNAAVNRIRERMQQLATDAKRSMIFEILADTDRDRLREIIGKRASVIVAPTLITREPVYLYLSDFDTRIELVDENDAVSP